MTHAVPLRRIVVGVDGSAASAAAVRVGRVIGQLANIGVRAQEHAQPVTAADDARQAARRPQAAG